MANIYLVSFKIGSFYHSNIALAETAEDVRAHYSEYTEVSVSDGNEGDLREAERKGKPIITVEHKEAESVEVKKVINEALDGIELYFAEMPTEETRTTLKANGFRWNRAKRCWYAKRKPETLATADDIASGAPVSAPTVKAAKTPERINLDGLQNLPCLYGSDLTKAIREDLKKRGVKGVTVRKNHSTVVITVTATAEDIASVEEMKTRYNVSAFGCDAERGFYNGTRWIYNYSELTEEEKATEYHNNIMYRLTKCHSFNIYHQDRTNYPELTTAFYNKLVAVFKISNQWNYDNSDIMTDYFDRGYYLDIDIKTPSDFVPRESMTEEERTAYNKEIAEQIEANKRAFEEFQRREAEEKKAREAYEEQRKADRELINNNISVVDLPEADRIYINNLVGGIGKECNLAELEETISTNPTTGEALISRKVIFKTSAAYEAFTNYLLDDFSFFDGFGGMASDDIRLEGTENAFYRLNEEQRETVKLYMNNCVAVYLMDTLKLVIDPEGYSYARYAYKPTEESKTTRATEETERQKKESENKTPFYFPEPVEVQANNINVGDDITIYQCDGWNLVSIYGGAGTVTEVKPGSYAQYNGVWLSLLKDRKIYKAFIRNNKKCLIYKGIRPRLPETLTHRHITDTMSELLNADELLTAVLSYYPDKPIIDTIQR